MYLDIKNEEMKFRLDRSAFSKGTVKEQIKRNRELLLEKSMEERLEILWYLIRLNYGLKEGEVPRLDRTAFSMRKHEC